MYRYGMAATTARLFIYTRADVVVSHRYRTAGERRVLLETPQLCFLVSLRCRLAQSAFAENV